MVKDKLAWCLKQKTGISLVDVNEHLSKSYFNEAEETFSNMLVTKGKWKVILAYYSCYNALYSILMKCGIKSEIHSCSIYLMDFFNFSKEEIDFMNSLKELRVQSQYYLKENTLDDENNVKDFLLTCKLILEELTNSDIEKIRGELK